MHGVVSGTITRALLYFPPASPRNIVPHTDSIHHFHAFFLSSCDIASIGGGGGGGGAGVMPSGSGAGEAWKFANLYKRRSVLPLRELKRTELTN